MIVCKVCQKECTNNKGLSYHIKMLHGIKFEDYLIEYELEGVRPTCKCGCGNDVKFFGGKFCEYFGNHFWVGREKSAEHRRKISETQKGKFISEKTKKKTSDSMLVRHQDHPEHAEAISKANSGKVFSEEHCRKISETRKKMFADGSLKINVEKMQNSIVQKYLNGGFEWSRGSYYSDKNEREHHYRSSWELRHMQEMDIDDNVVFYETEPFRIEYEWNGKVHFYVPDFLVSFADGRKELQEIGVKKLKEKVERNILKRKAAEILCSERGWTYRAITFEIEKPVPAI